MERMTIWKCIRLRMRIEIEKIFDDEEPLTCHDMAVDAADNGASKSSLFLLVLLGVPFDCGGLNDSMRMMMMMVVLAMMNVPLLEVMLCLMRALLLVMVTMIMMIAIRMTMTTTIMMMSMLVTSPTSAGQGVPAESTVEGLQVDALALGI